MACGISVIAKALNINGMHIDRVEHVKNTAVKNGEEYAREQIEVHARPFKKLRCHCPMCFH